MMKRIIEAIVAICLIAGCNSTKKKDTTLKFDTLDKVDNSLKIETFNKNSLISASYTIIEEKDCNANDIYMKEVYRTDLSTEFLEKEKMRFYLNDTLFYTGLSGRKSVLNYVSFIYSSHFRIPKNSGLIYVDTLSKNNIKIEFMKKKKFIEFELTKYAPIIILKEENPQWKLVYKYCIEPLED